MTRDEAIIQSMEEVSMASEVETMERRLKWSRELIMNRGRERAREQGKKLSRSEREHAMNQAMMNDDE